MDLVAKLPVCDFIRLNSAVGLAFLRPIDAVAVDVTIPHKVLDVALDGCLCLAHEIDLHEGFDLEAFAQLEERIKVVDFGRLTFRILTDVILPIEIGPRATVFVAVKDEPPRIPRDSQPRFFDIAEHLLRIHGRTQRISFVVDPGAEDVRTDRSLWHARKYLNFDAQLFANRRDARAERVADDHHPRGDS